MATDPKKGFFKKYKHTRAEWLCIALLCAPAIIHLLIFWLGVQVETVRLSFINYETGKAGWSNFKWAYEQLTGAASADISEAFKNTMIFFAFGCAIIPVSMFFAYLIFRKSFGYSFMRVVLYLPGAISAIMMALLYEKLLSANGPVMSAVQSISGGSEPIMLSVTHAVLYVMLFDLLIGVGANLVIWLGGMSRIPVSLIEYGKLEGIGPFREFGSVVLPLVWPTFVTMVSLQVIGIFGSTGSILILTNGQHHSNTLAFWMYKMVLEGLTQEYNHVAALGLIFTVLTIPIVVIFRAIMNRFGEEVEY